MKQSRLVQLARELISIPSFSGREHAASDWVENQLRSIGFARVARLPVPDSADTIVARMEGDRDSEGLVLSFHIDIEDLCPDWTSDPFGARMEQGKIFGAGAHDMKAGAAAILGAAEAFLEDRPSPRGPLVVAATTDEMRWSRGAHAAIQSGLFRGCRYALIGEPSPALTFHEGGRGRHILAVPYSACAETALRERHIVLPGERISFRRQDNDLLINAYVLPGRGAQDLVDAVRDALGRGVSIRVDPRPTPAPPSFRVPESSRIVRLLRERVGASTLAQNVCDANHFFAFGGLDPVIYGPTGGNTDRADEYLDIDSLVCVSETCLDVVRQLLGSKN